MDWIYTIIMKRLCSPWRMEYIMNPVKSKKCIFCAAIKEKDPSINLIVHRGEHAFVLLNRYPYTNGHLMVASYAHQPSLEDLAHEIRTEIIELITRSQQTLGLVYHPEGYNLGANIGAAAGAGVEGHIHFHIVPRWKGDTNFMSTLSGTRVLPETLEDTLARLTSAWV